MDEPGIPPGVSGSFLWVILEARQVSRTCCPHGGCCAGPGFASLVEHEGLIYVLGSTAILACYDATTGERIWRERLPDAAQVVASPWLAGDQLFLMDETGLTFVLKAGREYALERTNKIEGLFWGTPSVAGDALLLREANKLYCIR